MDLIAPESIIAKEVSLTAEFDDLLMGLIQQRAIIAAGEEGYAASSAVLAALGERRRL